MAKKDPKKNKIVKMSDKDAAMEIVNFARESRAPIVSERRQKSKPWVFWGSDNLYPNDLIRLADNSALHSAILDTKAKMIAGDGVVFDNEEARNFLELATEKWGGLSKVIERMATDTAYFSTHAVNVQFNKGGKIDEIKHSDISYLRSGKMDINTRSITSHYHSTRWDIATNKRSYAKDEEIYRPVEIVSFDESRKRERISRKNGQLIIAKRYNPSVIYYAKPSYIGAYNYIDISAKIANFHRNQLDNGMAGNMHIHLMQDLSNATKRKKVTQELSNQYTGTNNAGRIVLTWGTNPQNIPIVTQSKENSLFFATFLFFRYTKIARLMFTTNATSDPITKTVTSI